MSSTNSKSAPRGSGSTLILQSPNWPWPPVCFLWRPCASVDALIVSRYGMRGGFRLTSTPKRPLQLRDRDLDVQLSLAGEQQLLGLRIAAVADRRVLFLEPVHRRADLVLVAAALRLDRVGEHRLGELHRREGDRVRSCRRATSLVSVSFSLATAPRSPALISGTFVCVLPCSSIRWPEPLGASFVLLWHGRVGLDRRPDTTRNIVMRPANGSAIVFHTNARRPALLSSASRGDSRRRPCPTPANGRSAGDGR